MSVSYEDLKDFAASVIAVCNHQVAKNRPLSTISVNVLAKQFLYKKSQPKKQSPS